MFDVVEPDLDLQQMRKKIVSEWEHRSYWEGEQAVMSAYYPLESCNEESEKYVRAVMEFIGDAINGKDVLEIGAGVGRLTEKFVLRAGKVTCLEISQGMLDRSRQRLGSSAQRVNYLLMFAQDYKPEEMHDVVISSLVLIHNINDVDFHQLVRVISACADTIFLFEHTNVACPVNWYTRLRSEDELLSAFSEYQVEKRGEYTLFNDRLSFLKLVRK